MYGRLGWGYRENRKDYANVIKKIQVDDLSSFISDKTFLEDKNDSNVDAKDAIEQWWGNYDLKSSGLSYIHLAAYFDAIDIFMYLVEQENQKILSVTPNGYNTLHYACAGDAYEVASYIISTNPGISAADTETPKQYLFLAVSKNAERIAKLLCDDGVNLNSTANRRDNPISKAVMTNNARMLIILLNALSACDRRKNNEGNTPIMVAINTNYMDSLKILINAGERADEVRNKRNALSCVCKRYSPDYNMAKLIINHSDSDKIDIPSSIKDSEAAVHWICQSGDLEIAKLVLNCNIDVNRSFVSGGRTKFGPDSIVDEEKVSTNIAMMDLLYEHGYNVNNCDPVSKIPVYARLFESITPQIEMLAWYINHGVSLDVPTKTPKQTLRQLIKSKDDYVKKLAKLGIDIDQV